MSIYPDGKRPPNLRYVWDVAAQNLPIPSDLRSREDQNEWQGYIKSMSPEKQLRYFAKALDEFHGLVKGVTDPFTLSEDKQLEAYSKWEAASIANGAVSSRFTFQTEEKYSGRMFRSDIEEGIYNIVDFLKAVNSPEAAVWEQRRLEHKALDKMEDKFLRLLDKFIRSPIARPFTGADAKP